MSYTKHDFKSGEKLYAQQLNEMDEQIFKNTEETSKLSEEIADLKENGTGTGTGSGLNTTSQALLRQLLEATVYDSDVLPQPQTVIDDFFGSLGGGSDEPDEPVVTYTITNNLTNCTNSNSLTSIDAGSNYTAVISANEGYELETVTVTHGGNNVTVNNGVITISSVSGDIVITANAIEESNEVVLYSIKDKVCNADFYEPTGLRFGSDDANGVTNAWTITATAKSHVTQVSGFYKYIYALINDDSNKPSEKISLQYRGWQPARVGAIDTLIDLQSMENKNVSVVLTHEAGDLGKVVIYYVSSEGVLAREEAKPLDSNAARLLNGSWMIGEVYAGSDNGEGKAGFVGEISDLTITLGKIYSEEEISSYLGV